MGMIATVKEFLRETVEGAFIPSVKVDTGGEDTLIAAHGTPPGVDAVPLDNDYVLLAKGAGTGRYVIVGYIDPVNEGTAVKGAWRAYARNPEDGSVRATIRLAEDEDFVHLGQDVCEHGIPRDDKLQAQLDAIATAFNGHTHDYIDTVSGSGPTATLTGGPSTAAPATPATEIKYEVEETATERVKGQ